MTSRLRRRSLCVVNRKIWVYASSLDDECTVTPIVSHLLSQLQNQDALLNSRYRLFIGNSDKRTCQDRNQPFSFFSCNKLAQELIKAFYQNSTWEPEVWTQTFLCCISKRSRSAGTENLLFFFSVSCTAGREGHSDRTVTHYQHSCHTQGISNLGHRTMRSCVTLFVLSVSSGSRSVSGTLINRSSQTNSPTVSYRRDEKI